MPEFITIFTNAIQNIRSLSFCLIFPVLFVVGSCSNTKDSDIRVVTGKTHDNLVLTAADKTKKRILAHNLSDNPDILKGLSPDDIKLALSAPILERVEAQNVALQFSSSSCVVDVFYTLSDTDVEHDADKQKPAYVDIRHREGPAKDQASDQQDCIRSLL